MSNDRILIRDLLVRGILGVLPEERTQKQDILINVIMYYDLREAATTGNLSHSVDYAAVVRRIVERVAEGEDFLAETLAHDLARLIVTEFGPERVVVRVEKPNAIPTAQAVGVEIERTANDFSTPRSGTES